MCLTAPKLGALDRNAEASADLSFELSGSRFIEPLPSTANRARKGWSSGRWFSDSRSSRHSECERDAPILCWHGIGPVYNRRVWLFCEGKWCSGALSCREIARFHEVLQPALVIDSVFGCRRRD